MAKYHGQKVFEGYLEPQDFVGFDSQTPLFGFVGATGYAAEQGGTSISFTIGQGILGEDGQDMGGQRAIIDTAQMNAMLGMLEAVKSGTVGKPHPHHQITPEQAVTIQNEFVEILSVASMLQANAAESRREGWEALAL